MRLIRFKIRTALGFFLGAADGSSHFRVFEAKECAEFSISETPHGGCTLTAEDGSAAPFVGREYFEVLPDDFALYRFKQSIPLMFGIYDYGRDLWIYDVGSRLYLKDSVHPFRIFHGAPVEDSFMNLQYPDGQILPEIHARLVEKVNSSSPDNKKSTDKSPKRVLESFPAPVPGLKSGNYWYCPDSFNSLRIVRDSGVEGDLFYSLGEPVAYLRLVEGDGRRHDKLYYRCSYFGVPKV